MSFMEKLYKPPSNGEDVLLGHLPKPGLKALLPKKPKPLPPAVNPADLQNRINDQERARLNAGGRNATSTSAAARPAGATPRATLTGLG